MPHPLSPGLSAPVIRIGDNYGRPTEDINGDRKPDISHGELVERYIKAHVPDAVFDRFELTTGTPSSEAEELAFFRERLDFARETLKKMGSGRQYDAVCMMQGAEFPITGLYTDKEGNSILSPENLAEHRDAIRADLKSTEWEAGRILARTIAAIEKISGKLPFYIAAGNGGPDSMNPYLLARGVIGVGATDAQGDITHYSPKNSLFTRFEQGTFAIRKVEGGYDVNNDGLPEVGDDEVSNGKALSRMFIGRQLAEAVMPDEAFEAEIQLPGEFLGPTDKLMSFSQLARAGKIPASFADKPYYAYAPYTAGPWMVFKADAKGVLIYDPDNSGLPGALFEKRGSSLAGPTALGKDLAAKRRFQATA